MARPGKPMNPPADPGTGAGCVDCRDGALSFPEAAMFTGIGETLIREAVEAGELETFLVRVAGRERRRVLIPKASLVAWLDAMLAESRKRKLATGML